jgi:hypothetical protein
MHINKFSCLAKVDWHTCPGFKGVALDSEAEELAALAVLVFTALLSSSLCLSVRELLVRTGVD